MSNGKKARKVLATLQRAFAEILIPVINTVIAEAIIQLLFG